MRTSRNPIAAQFTAAEGRAVRKPTPVRRRGSSRWAAVPLPPSAVPLLPSVVPGAVPPVWFGLSGETPSVLLPAAMFQADLPSLGDRG